MSKDEPRCFACGGVTRDGVELVRSAGRPDLWYDGCTEGLKALMPRPTPGRCAWCLFGWRMPEGVYACHCVNPCGCPDCSALPSHERNGYTLLEKSMVISFLPSDVWDNPTTRAGAVERLEIELLVITNDQQLRPVGDVEVTATPANQVDPHFPDDVMMVRVSTLAMPGA